MKLLTGIVLLCFAASCCAATQIVGGNDAPEGKYPYMVSLRVQNTHRCGGTILNNKYILTAAHCVYTLQSTPTVVTVVAGTTLLSGGIEQIYQSDYILAHPSFNVATLQDDIAVLRVSKVIRFNDKVKPIGLTNKNPYEDGYPATLTGWGDTSASVSTPNHLQQINLKLIDQEKCKRAFARGSIMDSQICTLTQRGQGACLGDSGSPLVADGVQVGVVSYGVPCARGYPEVYARVYFYLDWIAAAIATS